MSTSSLNDWQTSDYVNVVRECFMCDNPDGSLNDASLQQNIFNLNFRSHPIKKILRPKFSCSGNVSFDDKIINYNFIRNFHPLFINYLLQSLRWEAPSCAYLMGKLASYAKNPHKTTSRSFTCGCDKLLHCQTFGGKWLSFPIWMIISGVP